MYFPKPEDVWDGNDDPPPAPITLTSVQCCGIVEASSCQFHDYSKRDFKRWLKDFATYGDDDDWGGYPLREGGHYRGGTILATATDEQTEYKKWLGKVGFERTKRFRNHNTGKMVTMYLYTLEKEEGDTQ